MTGKMLFRNFINGRKVEKKLFIPFIYSLAGRIANIPMQEMAWDATQYTYALESAYSLHHSDVICNSYDFTIECEACGCELIWPGQFGKPSLKGSNRHQLYE